MADEDIVIIIHPNSYSTLGAIVTWEKSVGESVNVDDVLLVVDTDKISIDIRSPHSGVLVKQHVAVDDNVCLCRIEHVCSFEIDDVLL